MNQCYVCGAACDLDSGESACSQCGTAFADLLQLEKAAARKRFLFGRVARSPEVEEAPPKTAPKPRARPAKPRPKAKTSGIEEPTLHRDFESDGVDSLDPAITNRDAVVGFEPEAAGMPIHLKGGAHLIDVLACILLNLWVFKLILWISSRNFSEMVTFSLIPILFVMLSFTALYFYLFLSLFKRSLGQIVMEVLNRPDAAS